MKKIIIFFYFLFSSFNFSFAQVDTAGVEPEPELEFARVPYFRVEPEIFFPEKMGNQYFLDFAQENKTFIFLKQSYGTCLDSLTLMPILKGGHYRDFQGERGGVYLTLYEKSGDIRVTVLSELDGATKTEDYTYSLQKNRYRYSCIILPSPGSGGVSQYTEKPPENLQEKFIELLEKFCNSH